MSAQRHIAKLASWHLILAMCLLTVIGVVAVKLWPRTVPIEECSLAYRTYTNQPDIKASYIKDYRINDTVNIPVTILEAKTDSAWNVLQVNYNVPSIPTEYSELMERCNYTEFWSVSREKLECCADTTIHHSDLIVVSRKKQTICICHIDNESQVEDIINKELSDL